MNLGEIALIIGAILTPVASIFGVWYTVRRMRANDKETMQVALKSVTVTEKEAHTHEVEMIIAGFTGSLKAVNDELLRVNTAYGKMRESNGRLGEKYDAVKLDLRTLHHINTELIGLVKETITHVKTLEMLVPDPPGPPLRPAWEIDLEKLEQLGKEGT